MLEDATTTPLTHASVTMTLEFFVNGKPLPSFGYEQLRKLVDEALAAAPRQPAR
jgi:hypothetical protein